MAASVQFMYILLFEHHHHSRTGNAFTSQTARPILWTVIYSNMRGMRLNSTRRNSVSMEITDLLRSFTCKVVQGFWHRPAMARSITPCNIEFIQRRCVTCNQPVYNVGFEIRSLSTQEWEFASVKFLDISQTMHKAVRHCFESKHEMSKRNCRIWFWKWFTVECLCEFTTFNCSDQQTPNFHIHYWINKIESKYRIKHAEPISVSLNILPSVCA